jgi:hypothetical protein
MSDSPTVLWEDMITEHSINIDELPEKTKGKIANFDKLYAEYEACEANSKEEETLEQQLDALDQGIVSDLKSYVAEKQAKEDEASKANPAMANGGQASTNTQANTPSTSEETPSWRFWM